MINQKPVTIFDPVRDAVSAALERRYVHYGRF
jgi:hypothetical protein